MIETAGVTKLFGRKAAVEDLSFRVEPGRVTGFLGPNGAGKSTSLKIILGLAAPTCGRATVNGRPYVEHRAPLRQVGALLDARSTHPRRRGQDHLRAMALANGIARARVDAVLDLVGLGTMARRPAREYSLGMNQRLGIAAALLGDPQTLIFDEPLNGLDTEGIIWFRTLVRQLADQGRTIFFSSHLMSEVALTADHLVVIARGRLIADQATSAFIARAAPGKVRLRSPDHRAFAGALEGHGGVVIAEGADRLLVEGMTASEVGALAAKGGFVLHELGVQEESLEAAFLQLTDENSEFCGNPPC